MKTTIENATCAACGCVCEDITVHISGGRVAEVSNACPLCRAQLIGQVAGKPSPGDITKAAEILSNSKSPLIYGLAGSTVEAQRAAISLAEAIGGTLDLAMPGFHRAALQALQTVGVSTCTLGEVRQRADLIVFWGVDPTNTHPSFWERFVRPKSRSLAGSRTIVSVDGTRPQLPVDEYLEVAPEDSLSALSVLRAAIASVPISPSIPLSDELERLAGQLLNAHYSVFLFGPRTGGIAEIESLFCLVRALNNRSRCSAIGLGATICENSLTWQTGFPCCVNFAQGYPSYDPLRFYANRLLERGEVDSVLVVQSEGIDELSDLARAQITRLPTVYVGFPGSRLSFQPVVHIVAARPGVHCGGTVFRMDGVPIGLRSLFKSPLPTTEAVLNAIQQGVISSCI